MQKRNLLSHRELEILRLLIEGNSNKVIGRKLEITDGTVKVHLRTIFHKLKVESRLQAAMWAAKNNIFAAPEPGVVPQFFDTNGFK